MASKVKFQKFSDVSKMLPECSYLISGEFKHFFRMPPDDIYHIPSQKENIDNFFQTMIFKPDPLRIAFWSLQEALKGLQRLPKVKFQKFSDVSKMLPECSYLISGELKHFFRIPPDDIHHIPPQREDIDNFFQTMIFKPNPLRIAFGSLLGGLLQELQGK